MPRFVEEPEESSLGNEYYVMKSRFKMNSSHKGHTLRKSYFYDVNKNGSNPTLTRNGGFSTNNKESYGLLPVTEVDFYFDRGYVEANCYNRCRPIKEALQTSDIVRTLETLAVSKETEFSRRDCALQTTFEIPICGHYMPLTLDQLQEEGNGDDLIFSGKQECIPNQTKRPRYPQFSLSNHQRDEWRLHGGKTKKKSTSNASNTEGQIDKSRWLYYQGKYWDPSWLYVFRPTLDDHCETHARSLGNLLKLCPLAHTEAFRARMELGAVTVDTTTNTGGDIASQQKKTLTAAMLRKQYEAFAQQIGDASPNKTISDKVLTRLVAKTFTDDSVRRGLYAQYYSQKKKSLRKHLEIDLGEVCELTHIGFLGGYPHHSMIDVFPPRKPEHAFQVNNPTYQQHLQERIYTLGKTVGGRRHRRLRRYRRRRQVQIVSEHALSWVKRFSLQYRDVVSRKWCDWPHELVGNTDIAHEVRHKLSLQARMLRVIPMEYHNHRDFTAMLYGSPMENHINQTKSHATHKKLLMTKKEQKLSKQKNNQQDTDCEDSFSEEESDLLYEDDDNDDDNEYRSSFSSNETREVLKKKPFNVSMCYDLVHNRLSNEQQNEQNLLNYRSLHKKHVPGINKRHNAATSIKTILGKKVETIRYILQFPVTHAYNAEEILHPEISRGDKEVFSSSSFYPEKNRIPHYVGTYARLPEGHGFGFYKYDRYGQPSQWQVKDLLKKDMIEAFHHYSHQTVNDDISL